MDRKPVIGLVVAIELDAVLARCGTPTQTEVCAGFTVRRYDTEDFTLCVVDSGAGEIAAAAATQLLIARCGAQMIVNFGVVGALTEEMAAADLCVVERVIHYDFDTTGWLNLPRGQYPGQESPYLAASPALVEAARRIEPSLRAVTCASADKYVDTAEQKRALRLSCGADICEMESAGILLTALRAGVPCLLIKAVADSLTGGGKEFFTELARASAACFELVDRIIRALPADLPANGH